MTLLKKKAKTSRGGVLVYTLIGFSISCLIFANNLTNNNYIEASAAAVACREKPIAEYYFNDNNPGYEVNNNYYLTSVGNPTSTGTQGTKGWVTFDGVDDGLASVGYSYSGNANNPFYVNSTSNLTVAFEMKVDSLSGAWGFPFTIYEGGDLWKLRKGFVGFLVDPNGNLRFGDYAYTYINDDTPKNDWWLCDLITKLAAGNTYNIVLSINKAGTTNIYVDGVNKYSKNTAFKDYTREGADWSLFQIGGFTWTAGSFNVSSGGYGYCNFSFRYLSIYNFEASEDQILRFQTEHFIPAQYTISYNTVGGNSISSISYLASEVSNQTISLTAPTKTGYTFTGYSSSLSGTSVTNNTTLNIPKNKYGDITVTANWTANEYTITLVSNDDSYGTLNVSSITANYGDVVTISANTITISGTTATATPTSDNVGYHYEFSSWSNNPSTITGNVTITANFNRISGESAAISFAQDFNSDIGSKCIQSGNTPKANLATPWENESEAYKALEDYESYWLTHSSNTDITDFLAKYDYVNNKYGQSYELDDFMNRRSTYNSIRGGLFTIVNDNQDMVTPIIIAVASITTISLSILSILLIKKKKES